MFYFRVVEHGQDEWLTFFLIHFWSFHCSFTIDKKTIVAQLETLSSPLRCVSLNLESQWIFDSQLDGWIWSSIHIWNKFFSLVFFAFDQSWWLWFSSRLGKSFSPNFWWIFGGAYPPLLRTSALKSLKVKIYDTNNLNQRKIELWD